MFAIKVPRPPPQQQLTLSLESDVLDAIVEEGSSTAAASAAARIEAREARALVKKSAAASAGGAGPGCAGTTPACRMSHTPPYQQRAG